MAYSWKVEKCHSFSLELEQRKLLSSSSDFYIKTLNTVYPLGLNDRLYGGGCISKNSVTEFSYYKNPVPRRRRSHGVRRSGRKKSNINEEFIEELLIQLQSMFEKCLFINFYRKLKQLSKNVLRILFSKLGNTDNDFLKVMFGFSKDYTNVSFVKDEVERAVIVIPLNCYNIELLNLHSIFANKNVKSCLPANVRDLHPPKIFYKLNDPISLRVCNYSKFLSGISEQNVIHIISEDCICSSRSDFVYKPHGHIISGDLSIVENTVLRNFLSKGAKFRVPCTLPRSRIKSDLREAVDNHILKLSKKYKIPVSEFTQWTDEVANRINNRMNHMDSSTLKEASRYAHNWKSCQESIRILQKDFVITTVDKASGNFAFICKKFFLSVLLKELGFDLQSFQPVGNITYSPWSSVLPDIVCDHRVNLKNRFNISCPTADLKLPKLFWVPKLHKDPYKFRFIAGARNCTTKGLSVILNKGLSVVRSHFVAYCDSIKKNSGFNFFWSVKSSTEFLGKINNINKVYSVQVFDFSTLYTNLDQQQVVTHLYSLFDIVFNSTSRRYLCVGWNKSFFAKKVYNGYICFDIVKFKEAIQFIVSEVYVTFSGKVFKQVRGLPMGGNCSPLLADLFLSHCEFVFMKSLLAEKKFGLARLLSATSRYIDDLCIVNYRHFVNLLPKIYPNDLVAERNGNNDKSTDYLDIKINIVYDRLYTSVYHKVDDFPFPVVLMTFPDSLIPRKMGLHVFASQIIRVLRICSKFEFVIERTQRIASILVKRGYSVKELRRGATNILRKHTKLLLKFGVSSCKEFFNSCELHEV